MKTKQADEQDQARDTKVTEALADINDPKKGGKVFKAQIHKYNKPFIFSVFGAFFSAAMGAVNPVFGIIMIKIVFTFLMLTPDQYDTATDKTSKYVFWLAMIALALFVAGALRGIMFGYVSETITENVRKDVYKSVLRKHIGWHDVRANNSGVITSVLAGECSSL